MKPATPKTARRDRTGDRRGDRPDQPSASAADVDRAVAAARKAFETFSRTSREERVRCSSASWRVYQTKLDEIATTISLEMGAPMWLAKAAQAPSGLAHLMQTLEVLKHYSFVENKGSTRIRARAGRRLRLHHAVELAGEPDHVQGGAGARRRLHDGAEAERGGAAQRASSSREVLHEAGVPAGVFNLVNGDGPTVGARDRVASRASTWCRSPARRAPASRSRKNAADTVKRVAQELGGKSANIILDDADLERSVKAASELLHEQRPVVQRARPACSCRAPAHAEAVAIAKAAAEATTVGDPNAEGIADRPGRQQGAVRQDPGPHQEGHRRRRRARHRRTAAVRRVSPAATSSGRPSSPTCGTT